jgi:hypothetical protein
MAENDKYKIVDQSDPNRMRIQALQDIAKWNVRKGDLGGEIGAIECLSQVGDSWVHEGAYVDPLSRIGMNDVLIKGNASILSSMVYTSEIDSSKLQYSVVRTSKIEHSQIDNSIIKNTQLVKATTDNAELTSVHATNSTLKGRVNLTGITIHEETISRNEQVLVIGPLGARAALTTIVFREDGSIGAHTGCFNGTLAEFEKRARAERKHDYIRMIDYIKKEAKYRQLRK